MNDVSLRLISKYPYLAKLGDFLNEKVLNSIGLRVTLSDKIPLTGQWPFRLLYFERLLNIIKNEDGDIVECGVARGHSLAIFLYLMKNGLPIRNIIGYDSFRGLPAPGIEDLSARSLAVKGLFSTADKPAMAHLCEMIGDEKFVRAHLKMIGGWFSDTLPHYTGKIALLHLDADLYESTKCALENLWDKVIPGGIVAFDEYPSITEWPGEKMAVDEFFHDQIINRELIIEKDPFIEKYYIIKK